MQCAAGQAWKRALPNVAVSAAACRGLGTYGSGQDSSYIWRRICSWDVSWMLLTTRSGVQCLSLTVYQGDGLGEKLMGQSGRHQGAQGVSHWQQVRSQEQVQMHEFKRVLG